MTIRFTCMMTFIIGGTLLIILIVASWFLLRRILHMFLALQRNSFNTSQECAILGESGGEEDSKISVQRTLSEKSSSADSWLPAFLKEPIAIVCQDCEEVFPTEKALYKHRSSVHNDRMFYCSECGKGFSRMAHLRRHEVLHTGIKPYQCGSCGRMFTDSSNHKKHEKLCHPNKAPRRDKYLLSQYAD